MSESMPRGRERAQRFARCGLIGIVLLAGFLPNEGGAQAASQTLYACYVPSSGTVYRVKTPNAPTACVDASHVEFSWNGEGPPGAAGPAGPTGQTGAQGPAGPAGSIGMTTIVEQALIAASGGGTDVDYVKSTLTVVCPSGAKVLSGGYSVTSASLDEGINFRIGASRPTSAGWSIDVHNRATAQQPVIVYALCGT